MMSAMRNSSDWHVRPERGSMVLLRVISWISLRLGRPAGRVVLHLIASYFFLFAPASKAASRRYLERILSRPLRWHDSYKHFFWFASTIHDRIYLLNQRFDLFEIDVYGKELVLEALEKEEGLLLIGAHIGSFEVIRAIGRSNVDLKIAMAMYEEHGQKLNQTLNAINPAAKQDVINLGRIDSIIKIKEYLDQGSLVGMLGDRTLGGDSVYPVTLFGAAANLPIGPFRIAAILRRPVLFMAGLYTGGNHYEIHFEKLIDFSKTLPQQRQYEIRRGMVVYAGLMEKCCRHAPYNWFNFFDFWQAAAPSGYELGPRVD